MHDSVCLLLSHAVPGPAGPVAAVLSVWQQRPSFGRKLSSVHGWKANFWHFLGGCCLPGFAKGGLGLAIKPTVVRACPRSTASMAPPSPSSLSRHTTLTAICRIFGAVKASPDVVGQPSRLALTARGPAAAPPSRCQPHPPACAGRFTRWCVPPWSRTHAQNRPLMTNSRIRAAVISKQVSKCRSK